MGVKGIRGMAGGGRVSVSVLFGLVLCLGAQLFAAGAARAQSIMSSVPVYDWYVGVGAFGNHHTGFSPLNHAYNMQSYAVGGKAFVGYQFNEAVAAEVSFDYFGCASFPEGFPTDSKECSFAVTATGLLYSPPVSEWLMPTLVPIKLFARGGFAYKNIHQDSYDGAFDEGIFAFVVGGGAEFEIDPRWFMRVEYEYVSTAIGGPSEPYAALNDLFTANFGGTNRVVNAMHTEIAVSGGMRF